MPKLDPEKVQVGVLNEGGPVECAICAKSVDDGEQIAIDREGGFLAHRACFESKVVWMKDQHAMGHGLCHELIAHVDNFIGERGGQDAVHLQTVLEGLEMAASIFRRMARDRGATKDDIRDLREGASQCGRSIYEHMVQTDGALPQHGHGAELEEDDNSVSDLPTSPIQAATSLQLGALFQAASGKGWDNEEV